MLKTWNSVRSMNVFGGRVEELDDNPRSNWERRQREIKSLAGPRTKALILTGTPINRADHNTFWAFGAVEDEQFGFGRVAQALGNGRHPPDRSAVDCQAARPAGRREPSERFSCPAGGPPLSWARAAATP